MNRSGRTIHRLAVGCLAVLTIAAAGATPAHQETTLNIVLENDNAREQQGREQLLRLLDRYDVDQWIFTRDVRIAAGEIPHSHPVLTVNTKYLADDPRQMSTLLHEQFHWWVIEDGRDEHLQAAMDEFQQRFPDTPAREDGGARNAESNYLHLVICDLELQAMTKLIGEAAARELMRTQDHYEWIYEKVLDDPEIRAINTRHGLIVP